MPKKPKSKKPHKALSKKTRKFLMFRREHAELNEKANSIITILGEQPNLLKGIGNTELFFDILRELLLGRKPKPISTKFREKGFYVGDFDVAAVAYKTTFLLEALSKITRGKARTAYETVKNNLQETPFWDTYLSDCRPILRHKDVDKYIKERLQILGKTIQK